MSWSLHAFHKGRSIFTCLHNSVLIGGLPSVVNDMNGVSDIEPSCQTVVKRTSSMHRPRCAENGGVGRTTILTLRFASYAISHSAMLDQYPIPASRGYAGIKALFNDKSMG
jgi:hypothetical protein